MNRNVPEGCYVCQQPYFIVKNERAIVIKCLYDGVLNYVLITK